MMAQSQPKQSRAENIRRVSLGTMNDSEVVRSIMVVIGISITCTRKTRSIGDTLLSLTTNLHDTMKKIVIKAYRFIDITALVRLVSNFSPTIGAS